MEGGKPTSPAGPGTRPKTGYRDWFRFPFWSREVVKEEKKVPREGRTEKIEERK